MSVLEIGYTVREFVRERLLDAATGWNFYIKDAAAFYGFSLFQLTDQNLYLGRYDAGTIMQAMNPNPFPFAALSVAREDSAGKQAMRVTPSEFSGLVVISLEFYLVYACSGKPPDGEAGYFAVGSALTQALNLQSNYVYVPQGVVYNNEIIGEQGNMEWGTGSWTQRNSFTIFFQRVA